VDRRNAIKLLGGAAGAFALRPALARDPASSPARAPNIILIVVDDLRWDEFGLGGHPYLQTPNIDRIATEGAMFSNAFHTTPLCSPNRASILTGMYTSRHGIYGNAERDLLSHQLKTFPRDLQRAGYRTAHVGKWHMGNDPSPRPGFDYWVSFPGQGKIIDPELYEDGALRKVPGYVTDLLTERALGFIRSQRRDDKPFFLYLAHKAVHPDAIQRNDGSLDLAYGHRFIAAERHRDRYKGAKFLKRGSPPLESRRQPGSAMLEHIASIRGSREILERYAALLHSEDQQEIARQRAEMILSIDEGIGLILEELEHSGQLDNTVIAFTSDNGYFLGEHSLTVERRLPYEESVRAPLLMRYPQAIARSRRVSGLVSLIDLAPTLLSLARVPVSGEIQGRSMVPLLEGRPNTMRPEVLIEFYSDDQPMPWLLDADYKCIRTLHYKLIHWVQHPQLDELYDLVEDPFERANLAAARSHQHIVRELRARLRGLIADAVI
jgi:arylsulfatase A-like enzyme